MEQLETLKKKMKSAQDLQSVVSTMKSLAAVHIREYERAVESLEEYSRTVELGLQIALKDRPEMLSMTGFEKTAKHERFGAVIFGSDQGMCGQFNSVVAEYALNQMDRMDIHSQNRQVLALGQRIIPELIRRGQEIDEEMAFVVSSGGIHNLVQNVLLNIESWRTEHEIRQIVLFFNHPLSGASYEPRMLHVLPLKREWLHKLARQEWKTNCLPVVHTMEWEHVFTSLIRHYFYVSLWRSVMESLASENASRLSAMQAAEKNIEERLTELNTQFQRQRQNSITTELLDVVSGFESLTQSA